MVSLPARLPPWAIAALAGLLPIVAANAAYLLNLSAGSGLAGEYVCLPYVDGCVSISRAARSGPGLALFRWLMLPSAALMLLCWKDVDGWLRRLGVGTGRRRAWTRGLGFVGAAFLVLYVTALGSDGEWYRWQRRYGVILYFGGTALSQLLLAWSLWPGRRRLLDGRLQAPTRLLMILVSAQWLLGVFSSVKRLLFHDPALVDRVENVIEWWFALPMSLAFVAIAWLFRRAAPERPRDSGRAPTRP